MKPETGEFSLKLIDQAKSMYVGENQLKTKLKSGNYAFDSTVVVDLCLSVFWWAILPSNKSAVKIHTVLDLKTVIPEYVFITEGALHDVNILDSITLPRGSYLVMDKAYVDFKRLNALAKERINFVIRAKTNMKFKVSKSNQTNQLKGIISDQIIRLTGVNTSQRYSRSLRRVVFFDEELQRNFIFLTNNFKLSASTVAEL
jgi:hypothetical protein